MISGIFTNSARRSNAGGNVSLTADLNELLYLELQHRSLKAYELTEGQCKLINHTDWIQYQQSTQVFSKFKDV
jgi:hypothetical protein